MRKVGLARTPTPSPAETGKKQPLMLKLHVLIVTEINHLDLLKCQAVMAWTKRGKRIMFM